MKKLRLVENNLLTFEEGCNKYLDNCRARNLREEKLLEQSKIFMLVFLLWEY